MSFKFYVCDQKHTKPQLRRTRLVSSFLPGEVRKHRETKYMHGYEIKKFGARSLMRGVFNSSRRKTSHLFKG